MQHAPKHLFNLDAGPARAIEPPGVTAARKAIDDVVRQEKTAVHHDEQAAGATAEAGAVLSNVKTVGVLSDEETDVATAAEAAAILSTIKTAGVLSNEELEEATARAFAAGRAGYAEGVAAARKKIDEMKHQQEVTTAQHKEQAVAAAIADIDGPSITGTNKY